MHILFLRADIARVPDKMLPGHPNLDEFTSPGFVTVPTTLPFLVVRLQADALESSLGVSSCWALGLGGHLALLGT